MQLPPPDSRARCVRRQRAHRARRRRAARERAPQMQMIFQDPISSLNPRRKVERHRRRAPAASGSVGTDAEQRGKVDEVLDAVGLDPERRRATAGRTSSPAASASASRIARALVLDPKLIICDEPVSALDVSVQAQILNLLEDMKARYGLTLIFIAHDLAVVKNVSDRVAVMYLGKLCEVGAARRALRAARRTRTPRRCSSAIPVPDPDVRPDADRRLGGEIPSPVVAADRLPLPHPLPTRRRSVPRRGTETSRVAPFTMSPAITPSLVAKPRCHHRRHRVDPRGPDKRGERERADTDNEVHHSPRPKRATSADHGRRSPRVRRPRHVRCCLRGDCRRGGGVARAGLQLLRRPGRPSRSRVPPPRRAPRPRGRRRAPRRARTPPWP